MTNLSPKNNESENFLKSPAYFEERLNALQLDIKAKRCGDLDAGKGENEEYKLLESFAGLLADAVRLSNAEVSETGASLSGNFSLKPTLRKLLTSGLTKELLQEAEECNPDKDNACFVKQLGAFIKALEERFDLNPPQYKFR